MSEDPCLDSDVVFVDELDPPKVLGDLLESLAGAIFLDSGMSLEKVWTVFRPFFQKRIGKQKILSYVLASIYFHY